MRTLKLDAIKVVLLTAILALMLFYAGGCGDTSIINTDPSVTNDKNVSISVKSENGALDNPSANIVIDEAKALITEVEFELEGSGIEQEVHAGPFVINFNVAGGIQLAALGKVPAGVYNKVKFQIHKPEDSESIPDPEFREGTSGNQRYSFIIKGKYNGNSFIYKSKKSVNLVINFSTPVNFQETTRNLTIIFDFNTWFKNGTVELDPRNPENEDEIDDNLKNSFKRAFKDDDKNGMPDDN
ncbi:MAG: hypothetical protein EHM58_17820 [Ignavibacteriae bacterium]|nr:MAG: hypothetical protein EHM58_17820 [Ignavibacteriota bacterium]